MTKKLRSQIESHYLAYSTFTYPGLYKQELLELPEEVREIGHLVRSNTLHRKVLVLGNEGVNADLRFGDMTKMPWWRQPDDDVLPTAAAMLAELYRRDERGIVADRAVQNKIIVTCRFVAILMASILKSKGIPARVRAGHAAYFGEHPELKETVSYDHWITQCWDTVQGRWISIDVDGSLNHTGSFDPYDMPADTFDFPAQAWLEARQGKVDPNYFYNASGVRGLMVVGWSLFYDFHALMNDENIYLHIPRPVSPGQFDKLSDLELSEIDKLAEYMLDPDTHFDTLQHMYETKKEWRLFCGALL